MNRGASTSVTVLRSLTSTCNEGPAVSLKGSPTVSPTTAALCASVPFPSTSSPPPAAGTFSSPASMYFLALSQAPPTLLKKVARITPPIVPTINRAATASGPPEPTVAAIDEEGPCPSSSAL